MNGAMHDAYSEHRKIEGPSDRNFGLTVGGILLAIALVRWFGPGAGAASTAILLAASMALVVPALFAPAVLAPLNRAWTKLGLLLSKMVNPVIMLLMFLLIFVPVAIIMRLAGRDHLHLRRRGKTAASYWISRDPPGPAAETIIHQF